MFMLNEMRNFCVTAECLNFTTAAKFLYIEQPALSKQISRLEEELGVKLFKRTTRRVSLTPAGEAFLQLSRSFISSCDMLHSDYPGNAINGNNRGITIGLGGAVDSGLFMSILEKFVDTHDRINLSFVRSSDDKLISLLIGGEADFIYTFRSMLQEDSRYDCVLIKKVRLGVLLWKDHPLVSKERIQIKDLKDEWFIMLSPAPPLLMSMLHGLCQANGFFPKISAKVDSPQLSMMMTSAKQGITITSFASEIVAGSNLVYREIEAVDASPYCLENDIVLAWRKDAYESSEVVRQFADAVKDYVSHK